MAIIELNAELLVSYLRRQRIATYRPARRERRPSAGVSTAGAELGDGKKATISTVIRVANGEAIIRDYDLVPLANGLSCKTPLGISGYDIAFP